ncbi:ABC transporter, ABC-B family, MDR type [Pseudocercospora fijiensis CIRAD86]|uniref:ABC transporter, ABC-B family, MDR type n=1 Tax=Pseudocercospora fijiensis (strain CIRAD86) TaxID=383855 RepID=M3B313_PSEFD|nr:ABC transporter, ABC-B family, MDR type [Pseudocercospora fijiensis CIRAD86]EME83753.1 ABC transporter, ABC-B family, MDR type [Pseudocercospora fijiensis CIRAD86]
MPSQDKQRPTAESSIKSVGYNYLRVFSYADQKSWILNVVAFTAAIGAGVPLPLMELLFGNFVTTFNRFVRNEISSDKYMNEVSRLSLYLVYLFIAKLVLSYVHTLCISISAIRTTKALRVDFMKSLLRQEVAYFDSPEAGSPAVKVTTTSNLINQGISEKLTLTIQSVSTFVAVFVVAFISQWKLTLITLAIVPTILIITGVTVAIDAKNENRLLDIYSQAGLMAEEVFSSITNVHSFWLHPTMSTRYDALLEDAERVGMKKKPNIGVMYSTEFFCVYSGYALAFWKGIRMYQSGEIEQAGKVVTVIFAVVLAASTLTQIAPQLLTLSKAISACGDLFKTIDRQSKIDALSEQGKKPEHCTGEILLRDVEFAYPSRPGNPVLRGLSLNVPAGKTTALVGESGSGKSTIVGLLERWYEQTAGEVILDGVHLQDLNLRWLRTNVRLIQQEPVLFSGTVFENVEYGLVGTEYENSSREVKKKLVEQACIDAFAHDFISKLPNGYDTAVGERARMLSGGQKQRIAIARSIISDPSVLIMDEATSALDPKAEAVVQDALDNVSKNRTTIVIAHKLSTIQNADSIAVMRKGTVIEQGTHRQLLALGGAYSRLSTVTPFDLETGHTDANQNKVNYGLLKSVWILMAEQKNLWPSFFIASLTAAGAAAIYPIQAYIFSKTFEVFQRRGPKAVSDGDFWALMFFVVALASILIWFVMGWVSVILSQTLTRVYRLRLFRCTLYQNMDFFNQPENESGGLTARLSTAATNLQELLGLNVFLILMNIFILVSSSIYGIAVGWKLGLVCVFGALPPLVLSGYARIRLDGHLEALTSERFASSAAVAAEAISAIRTVNSLTLERSVLDRYADRLSDVAAKSARSFVWTMGFYALSQSINFLAMALGFWYGGKLVSRGEYTSTQFFQVFISVLFGGEAAAMFFQYSTSISKAKSAANLMFTLQQSAAPVLEGNPPPRPQDDEKRSGPAAVDYESLTFAYPSRPGARILKGVNVSIPAGSFAAFVGPSGCGKTTMISLLSRFYDPTSGDIKLDGTSILTSPARTHRLKIGLVQQEPVLYQGTIRDNIALGLSDSSLEATEPQIQHACTQANIWTFITSLPEGLNTPIGPRGSQLSGGQKQRLAIARAIIRNPQILLLDEATSALDSESEKSVQSALMHAAKQGRRTTIAVAHRLSTIRDADRIFVFEAGRIVEVGHHEELMGRRGRYYLMCLAQGFDRSADV